MSGKLVMYFYFELREVLFLKQKFWHMKSAVQKTQIPNLCQMSKSLEIWAMKGNICYFLMSSRPYYWEQNNIYCLQKLVSFVRYQHCFSFLFLSGIGTALYMHDALVVTNIILELFKPLMLGHESLSKWVFDGTVLASNLYRRPILGSRKAQPKYEHPLLKTHFDKSIL